MNCPSRAVALVPHVYYVGIAYERFSSMLLQSGKKALLACQLGVIKPMFLAVHLFETICLLPTQPHQVLPTSKESKLDPLAARMQTTHILDQ